MSKSRDWWGWGGSPSWGPWAGFGNRARFFEFGEVRLAILSLLAEGPKHGYQLMKEMRERSGGVYQASAGSVYPTLQQLEDEGLIESERDSGRRVYSLTQAGRDELAKDPEAVRRIWERAERWEDWGQWMGPQTLAFVGPMAVLAKSAMRAATLAAGDPEREQRLRDTIERMRHEFDQMFR